MRVVVITPYYAPVPGGLEAYAAAIVRGLQAEGCSVAVITSGRTTGRDIVNGVPVYRLRRWLTLSNTPLSLMWAWQIRRLLRRLQPDVINVHAPVPSLALAAALAFPTAPIVLTYHAGSMRKGTWLPDGVIWLYEHIALPWLVRRSAHLIASSPYVARTMFALQAHKTTIVTPAVDTVIFQPDSQDLAARLAENPQAPFQILFVGDSRDPRKGLTVLLSALEELPKAQLMVVGPTRNAPHPGVRFTGSLDQPELAELMRRSDVLVLPSTTAAESFGMVLIEAMACGLPVVASRIGGIPDVVQHGSNGLLCAPYHAQELVVALKKIKNDPALRARLRTAGLTTVAQNYHWASRGEATAAVLRTAAQPARPAIVTAQPASGATRE